MLLLFIVCLMKLIEMYSTNNNNNNNNGHKMTRNKCLRNAKENLNFNNGGFKLHNFNSNFGCSNNENLMVNENRFPMNYFQDIDQSCAEQLKEYLKNRKSGINSYRGMNDNSTNRPAAVKTTKLIKTGLFSHQQAGFHHQKPSALLKQPLSSLNTNYILTNQNINNNNYNYDQKHAVYEKRHVHCHEVDNSDFLVRDDALKQDVQIVLNNIQNALLNQQKNHHQQDYYQDQFQYLNIFGSHSPPPQPQQAGCVKSPSHKVVVRKRNKKMSTSPADCDNTNNNNMGPTSILGCSFASDFTHDNSDYQWFVDYGYRDGVQHHSILSSLSASYGMNELSYYDDLARNIDANLAEVDMENFRSEDIHSLLKLRQEQVESRNSTRLLAKDQQNELDNSICKSEILFSPVKESHISVDSLDMDGYPDDIILTCQANKNNYTIAFEGSCMYSDESYYDIPDNGKLKQNSINLDNMLNNKKMNAEGDMTQSDTGFTTWSQLKKSNDHINIQRYPSGNNNDNCNNNNINNTTNHNINNNNINNNHVNDNNNTITTCTHYFDYNVRKSSSMPNLKAILQQKQQQQQQEQQIQQVQYQLNVSEVGSSQSSLDTESKIKTMLQMFPAPIASSESADSPAPDHSNSNNERIATNPPSFNLVKLFIKQKSSSSDTCMDVSSGCWPSDSTNSSTEHPGNNGSNSSLNRLRKKSMNDSGKFSALSRHEEDAEYQLDSLDAHRDDKKTNDFNREIFDSPTHRRHYRDCALNIKNQMKNPLLFNVLNNNNNNNNNGSSRSQSDGSRTSENLTQILKNDSCENKLTVPIDMITKSIQTSTILMPKPEATKKLPQNCVTMVPPSFLSHLSKLGDQQHAPVYVIYPNYALPDLEFMNNQQNLKKDIIMSPLVYQGQGSKMARTLDLKQQSKPISMRKRPQSLDIEKLHQNQYSHVQDWNSLLTLLPRDYKKLLKNIPEVNRITAMEASISSQKPLFCMTPPIRRTTTGLICDCQTLVQQQNQTVNSSSSGGSSQPPSSGYRGSSTMLTDSEMEELINGGSANEAMRNMFVYQYDNVPDLEQRPPTGRRGILRRNNTTTNTTPTRTTANPVQKQKRYSMMDQEQVKITGVNATQQEKRRSLQDVNFYHHNELEEYFNNIGINGGIGGTKNFGNRLPNYMKTRDDQRDNAKDLNQLLTELELNKALSNKLNYGKNQNETDVDIQEIEARLKAESFLNAIPKSELRNYADIVQLLEWNQIENEDNSFEKTKLRNEVSKTLSSRKVSFNHPSPIRNAMNHLHAPDIEKRFTTPPNSPQMSQLVDNNKKSPVEKKQQQQQRLEKEKQDKIQSNRFKRLQIQWELLSKESPVMETKSNVTTPTGGLKCQSKIPRPVSYPNPKQNHELLMGGKNLRSPSRMAQPKKYTTTPTNITSPTAGMIQPTPRTPNKQLHTTPKKTLPVRTATRTR